MRRWLVLLLAVPLAGCTLPWGRDDGASPPTAPTGDGMQPAPRVVPIGGTVTDARDGAPIDGALARLDVAQVRPCRKEGVVWSATEAASGADGRFGPMEVPVPRSNDVAFFLHVTAPGYSADVTFLGPQEARGDTRNLTVVLHPDAALNGTAPPGTVVAVEWPGFPRLAAADAEGRFSFPNAHVTPMQVAADTSPPWRGNASAPADLAIPEGNGTAWRLEGVARLESGAPAPADLVAWKGSTLVGAARAGENGVFVMPLDAAPQEVRVEARTPDGRYGGSKVLDIRGPPAQREAVLLRALC